MDLSNRASRYIENLARDLTYTSEQNATEEYLLKNGLPAFEGVVNFQKDVSGFTLPISGKQSASFKARLFALSDIASNNPLEVFQINGKHYFFCGNVPTAPCTFVLSEQGEICSYDGYSDELYPVYSSGELLIENFALLDYLSKEAVELPQYFELIDSQGLEHSLRGSGHFSKANDAYNTWYLTDHGVVHKGVWLDRPGFYVHLYGKMLRDAKSLRDLLKKEKVIT